jgi:hypothetical protein
MGNGKTLLSATYEVKRSATIIYISTNHQLKEITLLRFWDLLSPSFCHRPIQAMSWLCLWLQKLHDVLQRSDGFKKSIPLSALGQLED